MAKKVNATRTINPLHFEDLEPHRFEDLVRRLLYSFPDWNSIEATGRGGSDDGFEIRAWEKGESVSHVNDEGEEGVHALEGRVWQIPGKREKTITPAKIRSVIREGVDATSPPCGYILAAATNISKAAYDAFREELRIKGVTELYFWGADYLEDQPSVPQNDEILFTFFGLSLSPRRRSRTTELKFNINNKNRNLKMIFGRDELYGQAVAQHKTFLLRDIKDEHYPYGDKYPDFDASRRWEEHDVEDITPKGVLFKVRERYAYLDQSKKQSDFAVAVDLTARKHNIDQANQARLEEVGNRAARFWRHLPRRLQAKLLVYGFVRFEDMLIIDERGDPEYTDPHIFLDFGSSGPFRYRYPILAQSQTRIGEDELRQFERVKIFPSRLPDPNKGEVHDLDKIALRAEHLVGLNILRGALTLYSFDDKLKVLTEGSIIRIPSRNQNTSEKHAEATPIHHTTIGALVDEQKTEYLRAQLESYAGRGLADNDEVTAYELYEVILPFQGNGVIYADHD